MTAKTKLVAGLGNPGKKYIHTRHNLGFRLLDEIAKKSEAKFEVKTKFEAEIATIKTANQEILLIKPLTSMNASGRAVAGILNFYKINLSDLLVVHDEIDLQFGVIRLSSGGSAGHKGIGSIIAAVGNGFTRLRIGIENREQFRIPPTEAYVLQNFTAKENAELNEKIIPAAVDDIKKWLAKP